MLIISTEILLFVCFAGLLIFLAVKEYNKKPILPYEDLDSLTDTELRLRKETLYFMEFKKNRLFLETIFFFIPFSMSAYAQSLRENHRRITQEETKRYLFEENQQKLRKMREQRYVK